MHNDATSTPQHPKRLKFWLAIRIEQYAVQFLTTAEEWEQYSPETFVTSDREAAYQAGRENGGLLCRADSVMSAGQASGLKDRLRLLMPQPKAHGGSDAATDATDAQDDADAVADALPGTKADKANKRAKEAARRTAEARTKQLADADTDPLPY